jgi:hypothetical protein
MRFRRFALERIGATIGVYWLAVLGTFVICHVIGPIPLDGAGADPVFRVRYVAYANESFGG